MPSIRFLPLLAGLALGSGATWCLRGLPSSSAHPAPVSIEPVSPSPSSIAHRPSSIPSLILPPLLDDAEAGAALEAWLALPPLAKDAPAAEIADRLDRLRALLTLLPPSRFEQLFAALATRVGDAEAQIRRAAFEVWTEQDGPAAARWALALVPGEAINAPARNRYLQQAALAWARDDFAAAYAWAGALGDAAAKKDLLPRLLGQLASSDPAQALALAQTGDEAFVLAAQRSIFSGWSKRDPAAALRALGPVLLGQRDTPWIVQEALGKWIAREPAAALDWAVAQPVPDGEAYRGVLANVTWNLAQSSAAVRPFIDLLLRREDVPNRPRVIQELFGAWTRNDGSAALAWLGTVPDVAQRSDLVTRALDFVEPARADDFMTLVRQLPQSSDREEKVASRLADWAKKDPDAALAWLAKHEAEPEVAAASRKVEGALIASLAGSDPAAALARWQALPTDGGRGEVAGQLAQSWAKTDSAAATRWFAAQLPAASDVSNPMSQIAHHLQNVAANWANQDPLGFAAWAAELPDYQRNIAHQALANHSRYQQYYGQSSAEPPPRAAYADKLAQLPDQALRDRTLEVHLSAWLRSDEQAARAWIEADDSLSPEASARLLTQVETAN